MMATTSSTSESIQVKDIPIEESDKDAADAIAAEILATAQADAPKQVTAEALAQSESLKQEANQLFKERHYERAIDIYGQAIELAPSAALYANRAAAHLKLEAYGAALEDANHAMALDLQYLKAYYRRGSAHMALGQIKNALRDFRAVCQKAPNDVDARQKKSACEKFLREEAFAKAIEVEGGSRLPSECVDLSAIVVESTYDGPHLPEDGQVSVSFVEAMIERFKQQKRVHRKYVTMILLQIIQMFRAQPSLLYHQVPEQTTFTICGDVHGQFYDLLNIFALNGAPSEKHAYLFNGDFVDRGSFSVEVICTLFAYKLALPGSMHFSRGNHETDNMNQLYGFQGEVKAKYNDLTFRLFSEAFTTLPIANVVQNKIFVVHGGLTSRDDVTLDEIAALDRFRQPSDNGVMCELLWSDPRPLPGRGPSKRGIALQFGPDVTEHFLERNGLSLLVRSHEVKEEGYVIEHNGKCVTVFSAPNYCDQSGNKGAYLNVDSRGEVSYHTFAAVPHPPVRAMQYASPLTQF